jgi:hypothetical protein
LGRFPRGDGRYAIVASRTEEVNGTARAELWPKLVAEVPQLGDYQTRIPRRIPVFMLTRRDADA